MNEWIPIQTRLMTADEKEYYLRNSDYTSADTLSCELPEDGQEVIVSVNGSVYFDIFMRDDADGCYFENHDIEEVDAWMPLPKPYEKLSN